MTTIFPNLGSLGTAAATTLALAAGEAALTVGTKTIGVIAQVSGANIGFDLFSPASNATYHLVIRGQDATNGAPSSAFVDLVEITNVGGWAPLVTASKNTFGSPGARTYTNNAGALHLAVANGATWYIDITLIRFPA